MQAKIVEPTAAIGHLVVRDPLRVDPATSLAEVASAMREGNVSSVLVGVENAIATERDLARALAAGFGPETPISLAATSHPVRVQSDTSVVDAAALMLNEEVRHLV